MNFEHTEDRRMLADTLDRFVADRCGFDQRNAIAYGEVGMSPELWGQLAELGAIAALFPEADGGLGGAGFDIAVVFESLGRGLVVEPFLGALMVGRALSAAGTEAQKALIAQLIEGSATAALAHDEPGAHHELSRVNTRAKRHAQGWTLTGAKAVVLQGMQAQWLLVSARTSCEADSAQGISMFLVPADAAGVVRQGSGRIDGGGVADIALNQVQVGAQALLGAEGHGLPVLEGAVGWGVLALCAEALGAMDVAKRDTLEYLRTRKQFGVPIGSFQALQHRMADVLLEVEQSRSAVINAAAAMDAERVVRERALSAAKFTIGRIGARVAEESLQLHGGIGMTWELPLSHYAKRLVMIDHQLGDEDHHLARYMALGHGALA
ncbi:acyl-CoA dehydrogenase family protein [Hydrogenophaga sp. BPS33]|uniref:acyl-CoA dehydrogenase family protein n=1 Tax=Hydrogenophaga sp. BPS33 TaxID=2651974 RepID=UPI00131FA635|nr:acyl-CoA dehydrogenase family protein [Hydrogenophaga sp. BPS33]QHE84632.1 pimeloyl-CoA dehydrogenase small subunit [Hydrogenophaga sp. BPS33]